MFFIVGCLNIFANTSTNNGVTRIHEGRYTKVVYPDIFKPQKGLYRSVVNQADIYLDYYCQEDKEQYAIVIDYLGALLDFPGILPNGCSMRITTANGQEFSLNSILVQNETISHLGETGVCVGGYFPLTKEQVDIICLGVSSVSFDIIVSDKINSFEDKTTIKGNKFSKEINGFYKSIQKEKAKQNISAPQSEIENTNIILLYHGYNYNPFLYGEFLKSSNLKHNETTWEWFLSNQNEINSQYNSFLLDVVMKNARPSEVAKSLAGTFSAISEGINVYAQAKQQENAQKAAAEKAKREQEWADLQARMQANDERNFREREALEQADHDRRAAAAQNYYDQTQNNRSSSSRSMETSDLTQHQASQMSDAVYGQAATNQALAQQRQYNAQQNQQVLAQQHQINQQQYAAQQTIPGRVENSVTSSGAHVQIKINGNSVLAYSTSNSNMGGVQWNSVSNVSVSTTSSLYESNAITSRYEYAADIPGIGRVYWGPKQNGFATQSQVSGTAISAIDKNGRTLTILVNKGEVKGYSLGKLNASSAEYQWTYSHMTINIMPTDHTDGEFTQRFKNKANIPEYGTVYF